MSNAIVPRCSIAIRPAVAGDLAFIDRLQQMHSKAVGFMPKGQLEQKISRGEVLVADDETRLPIGYCISSDRYFKRDEVGIIYQMNVSPGTQRKLVGAALLKAVFEHSPYGCKLFCCWCAQDLQANYFWESMGFVPLAFRTGAHGKKGSRRPQVRTHIFWQKRIREGDTTTPYWYPCKTDGGSMRQDRLVLPIPPHVNWSDEMPMLLPSAGVPDVACPSRACLPDKKSKAMGETPMLRKQPAPRRALFGPPDMEIAPQASEPAKAEKPKRQKIKADPKHIKAARELRDRYLEQFNCPADGIGVLPNAKYEVSRALPAAKPVCRPQVLALPEAA